MGIRQNRMINVNFFSLSMTLLITFDNCTQSRLFVVQTVLRDASNVSNVHVPTQTLYQNICISPFFCFLFPLYKRHHQIIPTMDGSKSPP